MFGQDGAERILVDFLYPHENYVPGPEENDIMVCREDVLLDVLKVFIITEIPAHND